MQKYLVALLTAVPLIVACSTTEPTIQTGDDAEIILDRLHRVDNTSVGLAFVDPDVDFSQYTEILLDPLNMDAVEIVQPSRSSGNRRNEWVLTDQDKENLQRHYREVFTRELQETGDYKIVDQAGPTVLRITANLTGIAPNAARDDSRSRPIGRSRVYTEGAGSMAISFGFSDSESKKLLAIVKDSRRGSPTWSNNNSVTNMSDVRIIFARWARMIRARLDIVEGY